MQINYHETSKDLLTRISIHEKYGSKDIDQWTISVLQPKQGMRILDIGCGAGKQCFLYRDITDRNSEVIGSDLSTELLDKAKAKNNERGDSVIFQFMDFNKHFEFEGDRFDIVSSAFAIYYATDLQFTFSEAHRVIKPGGHLFVTGPLPENKQLFYDIIKEASEKPIPPMPGSSRFKGEIFKTIEGLFKTTKLLVFENPISFPSVEPFMTYTRASLSEDRKLWSSMFNGKDEYEALMASIERAATRRFKQDGKLVMNKVVGGILATK